MIAIAATKLFASYIRVDGIWYDFESSTKTAIVTRGSFYDSESNKYIGSVVIPETVTYESTTYSVTTIGESAFEDCTGLTAVTIPNSIKTICDDAFYGCTGLSSVSIPNSVTKIGWNAFNGCSGLTSVTIPNSVTSIGTGAFSNCSSLNSIVVEDENIKYDSREKCNAIIETATNRLIQGCINTIIPNSVKTIGTGAFSGCVGLTSITIPNSVKTIGDYAFYGCTNLKTVNNNSELDIKKGSNTYGYVAYYASYVYQGIWVGDFLIKQDTIVNAYIGNKIDVTIPDGITQVGSSAFSGCSSLTSLTIPNSITTIGESAFEDCAYLKTITLGKSLTNIGCNAFKGDFRIEEITSYAEVTPNVCSSTFDGLSKQYIYLYVPENSIRGYQVDPNWNGFDIRTKSADKKPIDGDNPIVTPSDQDVTITWPITDGASNYSLVITKNGEIVCTLTFNAQGQLLNIAFAAPAHNGSRQAPAATLTAQGYQFTVTGLNPGTAYDYSVTATDAGGKTLAEHQGNFNTTGGGTPTPINKVHGSQGTMHKFFHNGNLIIERNGIKYTATGQKVR